MVFLCLADPLHADPADRRAGARVGWPHDGDNLLHVVIEGPARQRSARLGRVTVAPRIPLQLPADLVFIIGWQRQESRPADHPSVLAKFNGPSPGRVSPCARPQQSTSAAPPAWPLIADPVHRRSEPSCHLDLAQCRRDIIDGPPAQDQAVGYRLLGHYVTIAAAEGPAAWPAGYSPSRAPAPDLLLFAKEVKCASL
jgi:hypothetical protein